MVSTVTTTTVTTIAALASAGTLALFGIILLLVFLVQKELASATENRFALALGRVVNIAIVPLFLAFVFVVAVKVLAVFQYNFYTSPGGPWGCGSAAFLFLGG